ncbi:aminotransferase class III-fold pyridoxal phosphate-dependent enzyme [Altererythrobacter xixiisoli]|uniref:Aminotransferase class III-fold pyridoxal phosphate-dependent enzyme n=1 Tax=Croceibacterium xixiisoli TaxID=1476466 RepID=A0A6I4TZZ5_9SPHN|nr:aminotransferase class III-fold pyridoxal phosphate-dependent enzyme [Croceibacterium xixiisoli]MXO99933.1 aminotransferase class III-fold pyridoxal phosphate-dependent enzyme [Croceibacterium xixiisoli]
MQITLAALGLAAGTFALWKGKQRLTLSRAKHPSITGHVRWGQRLARQVPFYDYGEDRFFAADGAPGEIVQRRKAGFARLAATYAERFARTKAETALLADGLSDLRFTARYRVPFQFSRLVRENLGTGVFADAVDGQSITDLDGNRFLDLAGSYGVNLFGHDSYKATIAEGARRAEPLGTLLGLYHPLVRDNVERLKALSGMDEVSFHMSGTEAVMQAVRLARYHTGRPRLVRFAGAYHGWWDDVQPGIGNPTPADRTLTLADMSDATLKVLATRRDIACVLVNPIQAMHPNRGAPSDGTLVDGREYHGVSREDYAAWLARLREVCTQAGIVLILDEVFMGFRLARGGAAEYFGVTPDLVTYGKTLGGGLPVGVLAGPRQLMQRWRGDRPADICFARGTFNAHPHVMATMNAFLDYLDGAEARASYDGMEARWNARLAQFNARMEQEGVPVRAGALLTVWTICYTMPSRYHWMLQYYLRAEGLHLSWVGTGRLVFSLDWNDAAFADMLDRFAAAVRAMAADGWWEGNSATGKMLRRKVLKETLSARLSGKKG